MYLQHKHQTLLFTSLQAFTINTKLRISQKPSDVFPLMKIISKHSEILPRLRLTIPIIRLCLICSPTTGRYLGCLMILRFAIVAVLIWRIKQEWVRQRVLHTLITSRARSRQAESLSFLQALREQLLLKRKSMVLYIKSPIPLLVTSFR